MKGLSSLNKNTKIIQKSRSWPKSKPGFLLGESTIYALPINIRLLARLIINQFKLKNKKHTSVDKKMLLC